MQILEKVALKRKSGGGEAQEKMEIRVYGWTPDPTVAVVLRTVLQKGRNVALKRANPRKGRFKEEIGRKRGPGRKGGGGEGKPSPLHVFNTRRWVGEFYPPKRLLRDAFPAQNTILSAQKAPAGRFSGSKYNFIRQKGPCGTLLGLFLKNTENLTFFGFEQFKM